MAHFKDILQSPQGWVHELAQAEIYPDAERLLQFGCSFEPQQLIEESAVNFLTELRELFSEYARVLNSYSENGSKFQDVKIYNVAQTASDFMLFRNQIKLVISNSAHGVIQVAFAQHVRGSVAVDGYGDKGFEQPQELLAQIGPFRNVYWTFQGEKVSPEQVAKFYFSEFVRLTRDQKRSKGGNQLLLDQIKTLLKEKGLDL
ncbi:MAG: hypothetical protein AABZ06_10230 [Bdellovibrionota bacterium]